MLDIVEMEEPVFYDMYLVDGSELTPIPVRIINYRVSKCVCVCLRVRVSIC